MNPLTIRHAGMEDIPAVAELFDQYRQFYKQPADLPLAQRFIAARISRGESIILCAYRPPAAATAPRDASRSLLGFCQLYPSFCSVAAAEIFVLYDLFITAESRGRGAGKALLLAAEQEARQRNIKRIDLSTAHTNSRAQALYEALGWEPDREFCVYSKII